MQCLDLELSVCKTEDMNNCWPAHIIRQNEHYLAPPPQAQFAIRRVARERWGPGSSAITRKHNRHIILLVLRGQATITSQQWTSHLQPGFILSSHAFWESDIRVGEKPLDIVLIEGFGEALLSQIQQHCGFWSGTFSIDNAAAVENIFNTLLTAASAGGPFAQEICNSYARVLLCTIHHGMIAGVKQVSGAMQTYARCRSYIDEHFLHLHSAQEIAEACNIDRAYLTRIFKKHGSDSPYAYLQRLKLNRAAELLRQTDTTISAIADEIGFNDPFTFSKAFSRYYTISPSIYRGLKMGEVGKDASKHK